MEPATLDRNLTPTSVPCGSFSAGCDGTVALLQMLHGQLLPAVPVGVGVQVGVGVGVMAGLGAAVCIVQVGVPMSAPSLPLTLASATLVPLASSKCHRPCVFRAGS